METTTPTPPAAISIATFCGKYGLAKGTVYALLREGKLKRVKVGARTLIPVESEKAWWASQNPLNAG